MNATQVDELSSPISIWLTLLVSKSAATRVTASTPRGVAPAPEPCSEWEHPWSAPRSMLWGLFWRSLPPSRAPLSQRRSLHALEGALNALAEHQKNKLLSFFYLKGGTWVGPRGGLGFKVNSREKQKHFFLIVFLITFIFVCLSLEWAAWSF